MDTSTHPQNKCSLNLVAGIYSHIHQCDVLLLTCVVLFQNLLHNWRPMWGYAQPPDKPTLFVALSSQKLGCYFDTWPFKAKLSDGMQVNDGLSFGHHLQFLLYDICSCIDLPLVTKGLNSLPLPCPTFL